MVFCTGDLLVGSVEARTGRSPCASAPTLQATLEGIWFRMSRRRGSACLVSETHLNPLSSEEERGGVKDGGNRKHAIPNLKDSPIISYLARGFYEVGLAH